MVDTPFLKIDLGALFDSSIIFNDLSSKMDIKLIDKKVSLNAVRDVSILDLLGRQEVNLNRSEISKYIFGKKVLEPCVQR